MNTKLYTMDQHNYAIRQPFAVLWHSKDETIPHTTTYVTGFSEVLKVLSPWRQSLTTDEMFRIFIDNNAKKHSIMQLDEVGNISCFIKIVVV